jgi:hypothetical protein
VHQYQAGGPTWFIEGSAIFLANLLNDSVPSGTSRERLMIYAKDAQSLKLHLEYVGPAEGLYIDQPLAGAVFLWDFVELAGEEQVREALLLPFKAGFSEFTFLALLSVNLTPDKAAAINALVAERVVR